MAFIVASGGSLVEDRIGECARCWGCEWGRGDTVLADAHWR